MTAAAAARLAGLARAKVNLSLRIVGRRADGHHLLDSVVAFADWGDGVAITVCPGAEQAGAERVSWSASGPFAADLLDAPGPLSFERAWSAYDTAAGMRMAGVIELDKHIPIAAGLGGGTADAAAVLRLREGAAARRLGEATLGGLAATLGADAPACLLSAPARMGGIGERLDPLAPWPALAAALVNPGVRCPTGPVFAAYAARGAHFSAPAEPPARRDVAGALAWLAAQPNDLEAAAFSVAPTAADALAALKAQKGCRLARLTGSGATSFGLFSSLAHARRAAARIGAAEPGWWTRACALLGADGAT